MKSIVIFLCALIIAVTANPPPHVEEKINKIVEFINNFTGSKAELEAALVQNFQQDHEKVPEHVTKEMIENFIETVASKITSKVMTGDDFKKFAAQKMAEKGKQ
ncbi:hypothetical protein PVAND_015076 [Polypedilum vanderplanki]|uniref:Uncharacterized protein n=1 Tax=Polypedilum vanderplanki TaxID=319348 RepID=A0A9J6BBK0_POLVA|nr:hypothetical protein PVAND_015076 [Polypedilum vanderplanki]